MNSTRKRLILTSISLVILCLTYLATPAQAGTFALDFKQCANGTTKTKDLGTCSWINGAIQATNSTYVEGMSVPQRVIFTGIGTTPNNFHTLNFQVLATKGGIHAYDWLTSWDQAVAAANKI